MSIQPLTSNVPTTYSPPANSKPAPEAVAPRDASPHTASNQRPDETKSSNRVDADKEVLRNATHKANQAIAGLGSDLKFTVDEATGSDVVRFVDVKTKEVIRQIPAQEMLEIAQRLDELRGLLIKERV